MLRHFYFQSRNIMTIVGLVILLFFVSLQNAAAQDSLRPSTISPDGNVLIDGGTEDEVSIGKIMYAVTDDAEIIDQNGKIVELMYLPLPCTAKISFEPRAGNALPVITGIKVVEVLPDLSLRKNRISPIPE